MENRKDNMRGIAAMVCVGAGIWLSIEGMKIGGIWRLFLGMSFIFFGLIRGWYLLRAAKN